MFTWHEDQFEKQVFWCFMEVGEDLMYPVKQDASGCSLLPASVQQMPGQLLDSSIKLFVIVNVSARPCKVKFMH